jgi:hypothetical protein
MNSAESTGSPDPVRVYLALLEAALEQQDAAVRHDALLDAEAHLRSAIATGLTAEQAIADFGTPAEIASAYSATPAGAFGRRAEGALGADQEQTTAADMWAPAAGGRLSRIPIVGIWFQPRAWTALLYFGLVGFPLATAYFVWAVTVGSLAIGTLPLILGLPLVVFLLGSARALSLFEGKVVETFLGVRMPRRTQPVEGGADSYFWRRIWCWLRDVRSWMSLGYLVGNFPVAVVNFVLIFTLTVLGVVLLVAPILDAVGVPVGVVHDTEGSFELSYMNRRVEPDADGNLWLPAGTAIPSLLIGFALMTAVLWISRGLGWIYGHVVQAIQVARPRPLPRGSGGAAQAAAA